MNRRLGGMVNMKFKGMGVLGVIAIIAAVLIVAAVLIGKGGGKGDGEGSGDKPESSSQVSAETTIPVITTESIQYIEIVVKGNEYLFSNNKYTVDNIDSLITAVKKESQEKDIQVQVRDDGASVKAYKTLLSEFKSNKISFAESDEKE